jgi:pyruvate dehydrogenase E2 component (dihydrolipoamide acetyltransferase)
MAADVIVPEVGELGMDVTFVRWLKEPGDEVVVGDPLFEVDTDKSIMTVEAYAAGTLVETTVGEGDIVTPRQVIGHILAPGEVRSIPPATTAPTPGASAGAVESSSAAPADTFSSTRSAVGTSIGASPRARRAAQELGVDLAALKGNGPGGLVTEADVLAAAQSVGRSQHTDDAATDRLVGPEDRAARARRATAEMTSRAWSTVPHFYLQVDADVEVALDLARPTPLLCAAVARALARHPECNLEWRDDVPERRSRVDLGLLVDTPMGLLIGVIADADRLSLADMAEAVGAAAARAQSGRLESIDAGHRSLTISNLGMYPVDRFAAVISAPDILTLAVGRVRTEPRWQGSAFVPRRAVTLTLTADHRAIDGAAAARFLATLESLLRDPIAEGLA